MAFHIRVPTTEEEKRIYIIWQVDVKHVLLDGAITSKLDNIDKT
jgi:hypothetical protein